MCVLSEISEVRTGYDRWAVVYDTDNNPMQTLEEPVIRSAFGDVDGLSVLDLGCGTGRHALHLAREGAEVIGLDFSEGMLAEARRKPGAEAVDFRIHDLHEPLPFAAGQFDLVVSGLVLEHLQDLGAFFREVQRVTKPGGRSIISAMHPAMFLRGSQARFTDPKSGELIRPGSLPHLLGEMVMAAVSADLRLTAVTEHSPDSKFAERFGMRESSIDWPMLVVLELHRPVEQG